MYGTQLRPVPSLSHVRWGLEGLEANITSERIRSHPTLARGKKGVSSFVRGHDRVGWTSRSVETILACAERREGSDAGSQAPHLQTLRRFEEEGRLAEQAWLGKLGVRRTCGI